MDNGERKLEKGYEILRGPSAGLAFETKTRTSKLVPSETVTATTKVADVLDVFGQLKILRTNQTYLEIDYTSKRSTSTNRKSNPVAAKRLINDRSEIERNKNNQLVKPSQFEEDVYLIKLDHYEWFPKIDNKVVFALKPYAGQAFMITDSHGKANQVDPTQFRAEKVHAGVKAFKEAGMKPSALRLGTWVILKELCGSEKEDSYYARLAAMEFPIDLAIGIALYGDYSYTDFKMLKEMPGSYVKDLLEVTVV
jgi:hypothetical protein